MPYAHWCMVKNELVLYITLTNPVKPGGYGRNYTYDR
jgi:hypothetical protein